jgi:S1-C subfamily serine protease
MSTKNPMTLFLSAKPKKWFIVSSTLMLIFIVTKFALPSQASASAVPGGNIHNSVVRAVDIDKPAIVRILTTMDGRLTVQFTDQESVTFPLNGGTYKLELSGSGAFISSNGDILTADHVVQPPHDASMDNALQELAAADVANYINQNFAPDIPYGADEVAADLSTGDLPSESQYDAPTSEVYLSTDYTGQLNATTLASTPDSMHAPVDKIEGESPVAKNDIAIVHVNMENTPSIPLGDSSAVAEQDNLTIIGFPGNGDIGDPDKPDPTSYLTSSVNQIYVSSIKQNASQGTLIQVGGNVEPGDSGGPALDSNGDIVGIVSFYNQDGDGPDGTSFLQASSSAQNVLSTLPTIDLKPGKLQQAWQQAFAQYTSTSADHWQQASADFQNIESAYPDFQAVTPFAAYTAEQAKNATPSQSSPLSTYLILLFIAVIIIILGLPVVLFRRRKKNQLAATTATQQNYPSYASATALAPEPDSQTAYTNNGIYTQQPTEEEQVTLLAEYPEAESQVAEPTNDESEKVAPAEPDIDASIPSIATDPPKHFNPYAPQPMSWQAFQELASPTAPVSYKSNNPSEEPTMYEPMPEEKTERIQPAPTTEEDTSSPLPPKQSSWDEKQDTTNKFPEYD